jgi:hypothetical protein
MGGLWLSLSQRYDHLRGKILLREDLFQAALTSFADATKLEARSVRIEWNAGKLYALLVRRMATFDKLRDWLVNVAEVALSKQKHLGHVPKPEFDEDEQSRFANKLVGQYMGAGPTKGVSYKWLISHLQDANLRVTPRSILELIRGAAETALQRGPKAPYRRLLDPIELQSSLEKASKRRVDELRETTQLSDRSRAYATRRCSCPRRKYWPPYAASARMRPRVRTRTTHLTS